MPKPPSPSAPSAADQALQQAMFALQMQWPAEAEQLAGGVMKANRGNVFAALLFARALMMQGRAAEAISPLERAARRADNPEIETQLAAALFSSDRRDEALDMLDKANKRQPPFLPAFLEYSGQLSILGRYADAIALLKRALAFAPKHGLQSSLKLGRARR